MHGDNSHFPTFHSLGQAFRFGPRAGGTAHWIARNLLSERGILRAALYVILGLCLIHSIASRIVSLQSGYATPSALWGMNRGVYGGGPFSTNPFTSGSWSFAVMAVTVFLLGPTVGELAPLVAVVCLVGLAVSARRQDNERPATVTEPLPDREPAPVPAPEPAPTVRHPLDPDPDDLPLEPLWKKTSRPSR